MTGEKDTLDVRSWSLDCFGDEFGSRILANKVVGASVRMGRGVV